MRMALCIVLTAIMLASTAGCAWPFRRGPAGPISEEWRKQLDEKDGLIGKLKGENAKRGNALLALMIPVLVLAIGGGIFLAVYLRNVLGFALSGGAVVALLLDIVFLRYGNVLAIGALVILCLGMALLAAWGIVRLRRMLKAMTNGVEEIDAAAKADLISIQEMAGVRKAINRFRKKAEPS